MKIISGQSWRKLLFALVSILITIGIISCGGRNHRRQDRTLPRVANQTHVNQTGKGGTTKVPLSFEHGVYYLTVNINDVPMKFIYDTGASTISLSQVEAVFLIRQGTLTEEDLMGSAYFSDANGEISEGTMVILRKVQIGDRIIHDVQASIVPNQVAPLLLGQSALQQLGTITMDYNHNQLIIK